MKSILNQNNVFAERGEGKGVYHVLEVFDLTVVVLFLFQQQPHCILPNVVLRRELGLMVVAFCIWS